MKHILELLVIGVLFLVATIFISIFSLLFKLKELLTNGIRFVQNFFEKNKNL
tara:strand:- start:16 stop:171 length:156 start_codon:yes stop_codon:yes gene_type:complete